MKAYEITAAFFYGGSDETDDRVIWVLAQDAETIQAFHSSHLAGQHLCGEVHGIAHFDNEADFRRAGGDYVLPRDEQALRRMLNVFYDNPPRFERDTLLEIVNTASGHSY